MLFFKFNLRLNLNRNQLLILILFVLIKTSYQISDLGDEDINTLKRNPEGCNTQIATVVGLQYKPGTKTSLSFCNADALKGGNCCSD